MKCRARNKLGDKNYTDVIFITPPSPNKNKIYVSSMDTLDKFTKIIHIQIHKKKHKIFQKKSHFKHNHFFDIIQIYGSISWHSRC